MLFRRKLSKQADIFISSKEPAPGRKISFNYKSKALLRIFGIVTMGLFLLLTGIFMLVPQSNSLASSANVKAAENAVQQKHDDSDWCDNTTDQPVDQKKHKNNSDCGCDCDYSDTYIAPSINIGTAIRYIDTQPSYPTYTPQPGQGIGAISSQILGIQQNLANQMQTCVNNAQNMANQIINMKNQQKQIQDHKDNLQQQAWDIDTSTDSGQRHKDALDRKIQNLQDQSDAYDRAISDAQDQYNTSNNNCTDRVDQIRRNREDAESNLDDAFNKGMDIQIPY